MKSLAKWFALISLFMFSVVNVAAAHTLPGSYVSVTFVNNTKKVFVLDKAMSQSTGTIVQMVGDELGPWQSTSGKALQKPREKYVFEVLLIYVEKGSSAGEPYAFGFYSGENIISESVNEKKYVIKKDQRFVDGGTVVTLTVSDRG